MRTLNHIPQVQAGKETSQIVGDQGLTALRPPASGMGTDEAVLETPQLRVLREGFGVEDVERGAADLLVGQGGAQRVLVDRGPAADVDDPGVRGKHGEAVGVEGVAGRVAAGQDHDEGVRGGQEGGQVRVGEDLHAVAHAGGARDALDVGAQQAQRRCQRLGDVAEPPHQHVGAAQRREAALGPVGLRPAQVLRPGRRRPRLVVAHLVELARRHQQQAQRVLGHRVVVQSRPRRDGDAARVEPGVQHVVGPRRQGLDPFQVLHA